MDGRKNVGRLCSLGNSGWEVGGRKPREHRKARTLGGGNNIKEKAIGWRLNIGHKGDGLAPTESGRLRNWTSSWWKQLPECHCKSLPGLFWAFMV